MKSIITKEGVEKVVLVDIDSPVSGKDECLIRLSYSALNRRDQWIREGLYPGIEQGVTLGSDGCGVVIDGPESWKGRTVMINPNINWGDNQRTQSEKYTILGLPVNGTLSELISVPIDRLVEKPEYLSAQEAAAIPLAGLTAFRACHTRAGIVKGEKVLVTGAGGGVTQFAVAIALAVGCQVYVTSSSQTKIDKMTAVGAHGGFLYTVKDWVDQALKETAGFDAIIDGAGGDGLNDLMKVVKPGGRIAVYGATAGKTKDFDVRKLFWSQISLLGTTMGSDQEFNQMIDFFEHNQIKPIIDKTFDFEDYLNAFNRFKDKDHFGKIVLKISKED